MTSAYYVAVRTFIEKIFLERGRGKLELTGNQTGSPVATNHLLQGQKSALQKTIPPGKPKSLGCIKDRPSHLRLGANQPFFYDANSK